MRTPAGARTQAPRRLLAGPFRVRRLRRHLLAVQTEPGAEVDAAQTRALHAAYGALAEGEWFMLLVDKRTLYSFDYEAQRLLYDAPGMSGIAVLLKSESQLPALHALMEVGRAQLRCPLRCFFEPRAALGWLRFRARSRELLEEFRARAHPLPAVWTPGGQGGKILRSPRSSPRPHGGIAQLGRAEES